MTVERWLQSEGENDEGGPDEGRIDSIHVGGYAEAAIGTSRIPVRGRASGRPMAPSLGVPGSSWPAHLARVSLIPSTSASTPLVRNAAGHTSTGEKPWRW
jgi:hypothetical protein